MLPTEIADLVMLTRKKAQKQKYIQAAQTYRQYVAKKLLGGMQTMGSYEYEWPIMHGTANSAQMTGLYRKTKDSAADVFTMASVPIRFMSASWMFDSKEKALNSGKDEQVVNFVNTRETQCMLDWADLLEIQVLSKPDDSNDTDSIWGLQYAVVPNATSGHYGQNPSGFSTVYGIDSSAAANAYHRNYTGTYTSYTDDDLVDKMEDAAEYTNWVSPVDFPDLTGSDNFLILTDYATKKEMKKIAESRNDNLGFDLDGTTKKLRFHGNSVLSCPAFETITCPSHPVYILNMGKFQFFTTQDGEFQQLDVEKVAGYETVYRCPIQGAIQMVCLDRRQQTVLYQA